MRITVAGQPHLVDPAAQAVTEIINGGNPFGMGGPASLGGAPPPVSTEHEPWSPQPPVLDVCL